MSCGVVCCVVVSVITFFIFGNGFPSRFVHFSFVAFLSFRVWPAEVHRITGAGRQSPVRQTELIIGIRDVHSEVSAWTSRTTLRWWDSEQDHLQHGAGFRSTLGWKDTARCGGSGSESAGVCPR